MVNEILRYAVYYVEALLKRPLWAIGPTILVLVIGALVVFNLPQTYQSEAQLLIEAPRSQTSLVPGTIANEHMQFIEQRVLARNKLIALADKINLFPELRKTLSETRLAQLIRQRIVIRTVAADPLERSSGSASMQVAFSAPTPEQAIQGVSDLVSMILDESRGQRIARAQEMSGFLSREVADMAGKLQAREAEWEKFFEDNSDALPARMDGLESELQEKDRSLASLDQSITSLDQELRLLEAELRLGMQRPEAATRDRTQLAEMESDLATKSLIYSDAHPEIRALKQKIDGLRNKMSTALSDSTQNTQRDLPPDLALIAERIDLAKAGHESQVAKRNEIEARIASLHAIRARAPAIQAQAEAIGRERDAMQRSLDEMRGRLSTAKVSERLERDSATTSVQVLEQPETPRYPSSPSRKRTLLLVLSAAIAAAAGGVYLGDTLQNTIRGSFDIRGALAGSTLIMIPNWSTDANPRSKAELFVAWIAELTSGSRPATT